MDYLNNFLVGQTCNTLTGSKSTYLPCSFGWHGGREANSKPQFLRLDSVGEVFSSDSNHPAQEMGFYVKESLNSTHNIQGLHEKKMKSPDYNCGISKMLHHQLKFPFTCASSLSSISSTMASGHLGAQGFKYLVASPTEDSIITSNLNPNASPWYPPWFVEKQNLECSILPIDSPSQQSQESHPERSQNKDTFSSIVHEQKGMEIPAQLETFSPLQQENILESNVQTTLLSASDVKSCARESLMDTSSADLPSSPAEFDVTCPNTDEKEVSPKSLSAKVCISPKMSSAPEKKKKGRLSAKRRHKLMVRRQGFFTNSSSNQDESSVDTISLQSIPKQRRISESSTESVPCIINLSPQFESFMHQESPPSSFAVSFVIQATEDSDSDASDWDVSDSSDDSHDADPSWDAVPCSGLLDSLNFSISISSPVANEFSVPPEERNYSDTEENCEMNTHVVSANLRWNSSYCDIDCDLPKESKVAFPSDVNLVEVLPIHPCSALEEAYADCRKGPWEEFARDHERFQHRIADLEKVISPCLGRSHRLVVAERIGLTSGC